MATNTTWSFQSWPRSSGHPVTALPVRPATWPSSRPSPDRSVKFVSNRSVRAHFPVAGSWIHLGVPRRVSSIPSTTGADGSVSSPSACCTNRAWVTGQLTWYCAATAATLRPEATCRASRRHNRPVSRAPAGISVTDSVNTFRGQAASRHRYCRLRHRTASGSSPYGTSRGRVVRRCFTDVDTTPHCGQPAALLTAVTTCTNRTSSPSTMTRSTRSTATPGSPNRIEVPFSISPWLLHQLS